MSTQTPEEFARKAASAKMQKERLMSRIVLTVQGNSRRVTPVRTGNLKRTLTTRVRDGGSVGVVGTNASYARYVHDGTTRMKARPFFDDGLAASMDTVKKFLNDAGEEMVTSLL